MRIKTNFLNLGLFYETVMVCSTEYEELFKKTAEILEDKYAVKTYIHVYDRDPLTQNVQKALLHCYSTIFMMTEGVAEAATTDEASPFREVYAYTQNNNPHSISLSQIDGSNINYDMDFPEDMQSFTWLHRKDFLVADLPPESLAEQFFEEIRLNHSEREQSRLAMLASKGLNNTLSKYQKLLGFCALAFFVILCYVLSLFIFDLQVTEKNESYKFLIEIISFLGKALMFVSTALSFVMPPLIICYGLWSLDDFYDVSSTFAKFRARTRLRLIIVLYIPLFIFELALSQGGLKSYLPEGISDHYLLNAFLQYYPILILLVAFFADILFLNILAKKSKNYLTFSGKRLRLLPVSIGIYLIAAIAIFIISKIFLVVK